MNFVKLNVFQHVMRLWDCVYPYNAMQAMELPGRADHGRIGESWRAVLRDSGLGQVDVRGDQMLHRTPERDFPLQISEHSFEETVTREMNRRIDTNVDVPIRPFIVQKESSYIVGTIYLHWIADSISIRWLMYEWFARLHDPSWTPRRAIIPREGYWHYFGPRHRQWRFGDALLGVMRYSTRFSRSRAMAELSDGLIRWTWHDLPRGTAPALLAEARKRRVTVNDLAVAALAEAVDLHGANPRRPGKDELAIGTIADLRANAPMAMDDIFGLFLGFTTTMVGGWHLQEYERIVNAVARQSAHHRASASAASSQVRMALAIVESKLSSPANWSAKYRRRMPMAAGISNVNMDRTHFAPHHPGTLLRYYRAAPTGPLLPLVISPTTLGETFGFGLARQVSLISDAQASSLVESITNRLAQVAHSSRF